MATKSKPTAAPELPPVAEAAGAVSTTTVADYGHALPIGVLKDGQLHRSFAFKTFRMKEERELDAKRKANKQMSVGTFVASVLAHMLTQLGPYADFQAMSEEHRINAIQQMYVADVMYAWICLRIEALGSAITFPLKCPRCEVEFKFHADLSLTDVTVYEDTGLLARAFKLANGIQLLDKSVSTDLVVQPPHWRAMSVARPNATPGDVKAAMILASIIKVGDGRFPPTTDDIDNMSKRDIELLSAFIDSDAPGAGMVIDCNCPECAHQWKIPLDWSWDFFFTSASL